jgi:ubiquinone/menaquinone biosynthesis C-methylase UbiE
MAGTMTADLLRNERLRALLDHPALFNLSQLLISGGQRSTKRWAHAWLAAGPTDRVLDVCCGTGEFVQTRNAERGTRNGGLTQRSGTIPATDSTNAIPHSAFRVPRSEYLGVDLNEQYIAYARRRYGGDEGLRFEAVDATRLRLPAGSFDRALFVNSMHHFPDELNRGILREVARVLTPSGRLVVIDMVGDHPGRIQRFFLDRDRGQYLRPLLAQLALVAEEFDVKHHATFDAGFTPQTIIAATPRPQIA